MNKFNPLKASYLLSSLTETDEALARLKIYQIRNKLKGYITCDTSRQKSIKK